MNHSIKFDLIQSIDTSFCAWSVYNRIPPLTTPFSLNRKADLHVDHHLRRCLKMVMVTFPLIISGFGVTDERGLPPYSFTGRLWTNSSRLYCVSHDFYIVSALCDVYS